MPLADRKCLTCDQPLRFVDHVWDMEARKTVRIFECVHCQKLVWVYED